MLTDEQLDAMESLLAKATPGEWAYRPDEFDDWGVVKSPPREVGNYEPPFILRGMIGQFRDPDVRDEEALAQHRIAGTDPWKDNAALIVALKNAAPTLIAAAREGVRLRTEPDATLAKVCAWLEDQAASITPRPVLGDDDSIYLTDAEAAAQQALIRAARAIENREFER